MSEKENQFLDQKTLLPSAIKSGIRAPDGTERYGANRGSGHCQIAANTDRNAILAWLNQYSDNSNTFASNRKEAERLYLWALLEAKKPFSSLMQEDLSSYQQFLTNPQPVERWVMTRKWPRRSPQWRPFVGALSPVSIRQVIIVINSLFSWLVQVGYLEKNPLLFLRRSRPHKAARIIRFLDEASWTQVKLTIQLMPIGTQQERARQARARWIFTLLFLCGLRISEVVKNTMGNFFCRKDKEGQSRWWLEITGKGNKSRLVPATAELMRELSDYRQSVGLSSDPLEQEPTPLLLPLGWSVSRQSCSHLPRSLTRAAIHIAIKSVFNQTAQRLENQGEAFQAQKLRSASAHWIRHTAGSRLANTVDLRHVRDTLGHASIHTTSLYLHAEEDHRHRAIEAQHRVDWDVQKSHG